MYLGCLEVCEKGGREGERQGGRGAAVEDAEHDVVSRFLPPMLLLQKYSKISQKRARKRY